MKGKLTIKKIAGITIYLLGLCFLVEFALRICFPFPEVENFNRINYQILANSTNSPNYIRNIKMLWRSSLDTEEDFVYSLNPYGYRDRFWSLEKKENTTRVMFVGDSFVEGMMAKEEETIPVGFSSAAKEKGLEVEAMNFGMMGIGLNEYIKLIVDAVPLFKPDYVFLVMFSNDVPFNKPYFPTHKINPKISDPFTPRLKQLLSYSKRNDPIPFRWGWNMKRYWNPTPDRANPWTFYNDSLKKEVEPEVARAMRMGDFNFFRTNWILVEERFLKAPSDLQEKLSMLKNYIENNGSKLVVSYIPSRNQVNTYYYEFEKKYCVKRCPDKMDLTQERYQVHAKMLDKNCGDLNIPYLDLTAQVKKEEDQGNHLYWDYDDHMRGKGYVMMGKSMFDWWQGQ